MYTFSERSHVPGNGTTEIRFFEVYSLHIYERKYIYILKKNPALRIAI